MSLRKRLLLALLPTAVLFSIGELSARVYFWNHHNHELKWLTAPFGMHPPTATNYPYYRHTYVSFEPCSGRDITYTINSLGIRGPEYPAKSSGILRILAIGGSTTYGVNNLDGTTWPALLERELGRKAPVEVLNGGVPEARLEKLLQELSKKWFQYEPDIVIYYGAYNEGPHPFHTVDASIGRFHQEVWLGRAAVLLHYRSLLYTYLVEKLHMYRLTRLIKVVSKLRHFQEQLNEFVNLVRSQGATPVLVLQVMQFEPREEIRDLDLGSEQEIQTLRLKVAKEAESDWVYRFRRMRVHEAQLFVEVVRRVGEASGVQAIDPPEAFAAYGGSKDLFCDEVHLTDAANELLAQQISSQIELGTLRRR